MRAEVYPPREDTYLLLRCALEEIDKDDEVLEVGSGSGMISENLSEHASLVIATDINPVAVKQTRNRGIQAIQTDMYKSIDHRFNLVLFNPPYLPNRDTDLSGWTSIATESENMGIETTQIFLRDLREVMKPDGTAIIITSTKTGINRVMNTVRDNGFNAEKIGEENLFFERIAAIQIK